MRGPTDYCPHGNAAPLIAVMGVLLCFTLVVSPSVAQMSAEEHASHHPGMTQSQQSASGTPGPPAGMGPPAGVGPASGMGGMGGMGDMMKNMGKPPPKELYPTLMALPELTPAERRRVDEQAGVRMHAGAALIAQAFDALNAGTQTDDYAAMHEAMTRLREGTAQLESGIAARHALAEGRAPRDVALAWFKQEMTLSRAAAPTAGDAFGITPFHLFSMVLLVAFALTMLAMYFFKMRRAAALFGRIEAGKGAPPTGSAPELAGGKPSET